MNWRLWTPRTFANLKKPVLLCVSASWCHWCHTMDKLVYADKGIARFIARNFVAVRVDRDVRPDIDARYNVGGWPSTLVLAGDGEPVLAATYVPKEKMLDFLREGLARMKVYKGKKRVRTVPHPASVSSSKLYAEIRRAYDSVNGGFGLEPKFPHIDVLEYLLYRCLVHQDSDALRMLDGSLSAMISGELFDRVQGGFFRYATHRNWTIPRFEKLLEDNARLLVVYVRAFELLGRKEYLLTVNKLLSFLFTILYDRKSGLFFGSQDADEGFCRLPLEKRLRVRRPFVDRRVYLDGNAAVALALFEAARLEPDYRDVAVGLVDRLLARERVHSEDSTGVVLLRDVVYLLMASVAAAMATSDKRYVRSAKGLAKELDAFWMKEGGFGDVVPVKRAFGRLRVPLRPVYENACAALMLRALAQITRDARYAEKGLRALKAVSGEAAQSGLDAATFALALEEFGGRI